mmetsp:Transcript_31331/g.62102  ORF Transcript_31331/g.62102 Transcript_31331/m.62102 type:complete len:153 (-) Transcript_31331:35-493(-)
MTYRFPAPEVVRTRHCCDVCRTEYGGDGADGGGGNSDDNGCATPAPPKRSKTPPPKVKVSSKIVGRSLKPVATMLHGMPNQKAFKKALDRLGQDKKIRNCGPGFILRKAMETVQPGLLEKDFVRTEDLGKGGAVAGPRSLTTNHQADYCGTN